MRDNKLAGPTRPAYLVESAENALRILLKLRNASELRVTDVSVELGVARSTAHRLLSTLVFHGFLRHDPIKRVYVPGSVLVEIALASTGHHRLRQIAMPHIERLSRSILWTVHLSVLEGTDIRFVDGFESSQPVRVTARVGSRSPAHSTSSGKVLLAALPRQHVRSLYPAGPLPVTEHTISSLSALEAELDWVTANGYATNLGENEVGLHAVAVPIRTDAGVVAAIAAARPASGTDESEIPQTVVALREAAEIIAQQLAAL